MLTAESLTQHEEILRADRDDEGQAQAEAGEHGGDHAPTLRIRRHAVQLMILQHH